MARYRKKPVEVEAVQWDATFPTGQKLREWSDHRVRHHGGSTCFVETLEGTMEARPGDWIIRGVEGEFYPCKASIFAATYKPVADVITYERGFGPGDGDSHVTNPFTGDHPGNSLMDVQDGDDPDVPAADEE